MYSTSPERTTQWWNVYVIQTDHPVNPVPPWNLTVFTVLPTTVPEGVCHILWLFCDYEFALLNPFTLHAQSPPLFHLAALKMFVSYKSVSGLLIYLFSIPCTSEITWYLSISVRCLSLGTTPARSIHTVVYEGGHSLFVWLSPIPLHAPLFPHLCQWHLVASIS